MQAAPAHHLRAMATLVSGTGPPSGRGPPRAAIPAALPAAAARLLRLPAGSLLSLRDRSTGRRSGSG